MEADNLTLRVGPGEAVRLDVFLAQAISWTSRNQVQQAIAEGRVSVNGSPAQRAAWRVAPGDEITFRIAAAPPMALVPEPVPLDVLYEDSSILVVNKPAGMAVHPGAGRYSGTLVNALLHHVGANTITQQEVPRGLGLSTEYARAGSIIRPGIVHRLDMDTSGLMVVAKDEISHRALQKQFEERTVKRLYAGVVWGLPAPPGGEIDAPVGRSRRDRTKMTVRADGRRAITLYQTITTFGAAALVHFRLKTGRTHQIRVHARHVGHPILGDSAYGGVTIRVGHITARRRAFYANLFSVLNRQALHAKTLGLVHPCTGEAMQWEAALPADMAYTLTQLKRDPGYAP